MRIAHLIGTTEFAGTEQMVLTIVQGQRARGHQVYVGFREKGKLREYLEERGIDVLEPKIGPLSAPAKFATACRDLGIDILHSHLSSGTYVAVGASILSGIPVVDHLHVYSRDISHRIAAGRGALIAVSKSVNEYYQKQHRIHPGKIHTILNGSPIRQDPDSRMSRSLAREVVAEELDLKGPLRFVTLAARIRHQKGQDLLIEAAAQIAPAYPDVHFLIVGADEDPIFAESVFTRAKELGLASRVHRLGFRRDIAKLLRASEVAVVPSRFEPFGLSSVEPMLVGTPLVASRVGGIPELLHRPELGLLIEPESVGALARGITTLLDDPTWAACIAENAEAEARDRYSVESMLDKIDDVYESLLTPRPHPDPSFAQ